MPKMQRISPFLTFDNEAEAAANFYVSIFPNSRITATARYGDAAPRPKGSVMTMSFELDGQPLTALNAGPMFKFTGAVSFVVHCDTQAEVDYYWDRLTADGGKPLQCGWLTDKFGLSWQITPRRLLELTTSSDPVKAKRAFVAMLQMTKIDIAALETAVEGEPGPMPAAK